MSKNSAESELRPLKTLERVFSKAGRGSRRDARSWIASGRTRVNGKIVLDPDHWVDLSRDKITFDGKLLTPVQKVYILLYKPTGYVTTRHDPEGRATVFDLTAADTWLAPVGRLDLETSGLLILTNDTDFAERVTNPLHKVPKSYQVKAATLLTEQQIDELRHGVTLSDGPTRPAVVQRLRDGPRHTFLEITITEGRNRQVRRMLEAVGSKVLKLVRTAIGPIGIGDLEVGKWRALTAAEIEILAGPSSATPRKNGFEGRAPLKSLSGNKGRRWKS